MKIQKQRVLSALCPFQPCSFKKDGQVVKQVAGVHTAAQLRPLWQSWVKKQKAKEEWTFLAFFESYSPNSAL